MHDVKVISDRYVAVWNEADPDRRRKRIRALWAADGRTCNRLLEARGYDEIEARVSASWAKFLSEGKYGFRRTHAAAHRHNVLKLRWEMFERVSGTTDSLGLSFLVLSPEGLIESDLQFNPTAKDAEVLAERFLAVFNDADSQARRKKVASMWAADGGYFNGHASHAGLAAIEGHATRTFEIHAANGSRFLSAGASQAHHDVAKLDWRLVSQKGGKVMATGTDLLVFDEAGRIRLDYQFDDPE
jgi:hypothetical protein